MMTSESEDLPTANGVCQLQDLTGYGDFVTGKLIYHGPVPVFRTFFIGQVLGLLLIVSGKDKL